MLCIYPYLFTNYFCFSIRDTRSSVLEESLRKLGVEKLSKDDVQKMQWEVLEAKIGNWIHFMRIAVSCMLNFANINNVLFSHHLHMVLTGEIAVCW